MRRTAMLWEVFVTRFEEAFEQYKRRKLTGDEATAPRRQGAARQVAQNDPSILQEIDRIKSNPHDHGSRVEHGIWPIEVHLADCRHF